MPPTIEERGHMRTPAVPLLAALILLPGAAPADEAAPTSLDSLVAAERAFSALSVDQGMKAAFLTFLAGDAILFRPGPVHGPTSWAARENPPGTLIWEPSYAEVSGLGDLGVSTGPWEYRAPAGSDAPTAHGHFVSMWTRAGAGPWRVALDHGISHARPESGGLGAVEFQPGPAHVRPQETSRRFGLSMGGAVFGSDGGLGVGVGRMISPADEAYRRTAHEVHRMMSTERTLAFELRGRGADRAYPKVAAEDLRLYRDGALPAVGVTPAIAAAGPRPRALEFRSYGQRISGSLDLGYSYGLALRTARGAAAPDTSGYLHVWRRDAANAWKLSLDLEVPIRR
jgi:ketosteroid isomerase-like protein